MSVRTGCYEFINQTTHLNRETEVTETTKYNRLVDDARQLPSVRADSCESVSCGWIETESVHVRFDSTESQSTHKRWTLEPNADLRQRDDIRFPVAGVDDLWRRPLGILNGEDLNLKWLASDGDWVGSV